MDWKAIYTWGAESPSKQEDLATFSQQNIGITMSQTSDCWVCWVPPILPLIEWEVIDVFLSLKSMWERQFIFLMHVSGSRGAISRPDKNHKILASSQML